MDRSEATKLVHALRDAAYGDGLHHRDWNKFTLEHTARIIDKMCDEAELMVHEMDFQASEACIANELGRDTP